MNGPDMALPFLLVDQSLRPAANDSLKAPLSGVLPSNPAAGEACMEFRILGPMDVLDGARRIELPAGRGRALLALLVLHAGEAVSAERLIDELGGEQPPATAAT